jgi:hypothetical protein
MYYSQSIVTIAMLICLMKCNLGDHIAVKQIRTYIFLIVLCTPIASLLPASIVYQMFGTALGWIVAIFVLWGGGLYCKLEITIFRHTVADSFVLGNRTDD